MNAYIQPKYGKDEERKFFQLFNDCGNVNYYDIYNMILFPELLSFIVMSMYESRREMLKRKRYDPSKVNEK